MKIVRILLVAIFVLSLYNYLFVGEFLNSKEKAFADDNISVLHSTKQSETPEESMNEPILLDVPLINQMSAPRLYNGCEVTSLAMMLNYHGIDVTKNELADKVQKVPMTYNDGRKGNPHVGFVGDMANGPGLSVYHGPIVQLAQQYSDQVEDLTGKAIDKIYKKVSNGLPVWIITTTHLVPVNNMETWNTPQGDISITFNVHSVVVTGYDEEHVYVNDPYGTKNRKVNRNQFEKAWLQMGGQAVVLNKNKDA